MQFVPVEDPRPATTPHAALSSMVSHRYVVLFVYFLIFELLLNNSMKILVKSGANCLIRPYYSKKETCDRTVLEKKIVCGTL